MDGVHSSCSLFAGQYVGCHAKPDTGATDASATNTGAADTSGSHAVADARAHSAAHLRSGLRSCRHAH